MHPLTIILVRGEHGNVLASSDVCPASDSIGVRRPFYGAPCCTDPSARFLQSMPQGMRPSGTPCGMRVQPATLIQNPATTSRRVNNFRTVTPLQHPPADSSNPGTRRPRINPTTENSLPSRPVVGIQPQDVFGHAPARDDCRAPSDRAVARICIDC